MTRTGSTTRKTNRGNSGRDARVPGASAVSKTRRELFTDKELKKTASQDSNRPHRQAPDRARHVAAAKKPIEVCATLPLRWPPRSDRTVR